MAGLEFIQIDRVRADVNFPNRHSLFPFEVPLDEFTIDDHCIHDAVRCSKQAQVRVRNEVPMSALAGHDHSLGEETSERGCENRERIIEHMDQPDFPAADELDEFACRCECVEGSKRSQRKMDSWDAGPFQFFGPQAARAEKAHEGLEAGPVEMLGDFR